MSLSLSISLSLHIYIYIHIYTHVYDKQSKVFLVNEDTYNTKSTSITYNNITN